MKVLHVYRTYFPDPPGGLQEAIRQIALATSAYRTESRIFALSPRPAPREIDRPEGRVVRARSWFAPASCDVGGPAAFRRLGQQIRYADVVHYHYPWPFADVMHLLMRVQKPSVMTYHSDVVRQRFLGAAYRPLMRRMLTSMDAVVATSQAYIGSSPLLWKSVPSARLHVIPLGIVEDSYRDAARASYTVDLKQRFEIEPDSYILAIGVLRYYKGFHTLIEAARGIAATIVVAGSGPEGGRLVEQARRSGARNVAFVGQVTDPEKIALLRRCRVFVLPSHLRSEAYGMVLVEAAMYGRPMISCEIGTGTSFVNLDGKTGFVISPEAPVQLAGAINRLLHEDALATRMGAAARTRYERMFSGEALGGAYAALYRKVLNEAEGIGS